jgi:hypothetical protein
MSSDGGILKLTVLQGNLYRDVEMFGKMDPFVIITYLGRDY